MFDTKSIDQQILEICEKLFERALNCQFKDGEINLSPEQINEEQALLLFAVPGIIVVALISVTENKEYRNRMRMIKEILDKETDYQQIYDALKEVFSIGPIPDVLWDRLEKIKKNNKVEKYNDIAKKEVHPDFHKIIETIIFLFHPNSIHIDHPNILKDLIFSLGNYFVLICMIIKTIKTKKIPTDITFDDFKKINMKFAENKGDFNIFSFSLIFPDWLIEFGQVLLNNVLRDFEQKGAYYPRTIPIHSKNHYLHKFITKGKLSMGIVTTHYDVRKLDKIEDFIGYAYDISVSAELEYYLWLIVNKEGEKQVPKENSPMEPYLFFEDKSLCYNNLDCQIVRLYQMTKEILLIVGSIMNSWTDFIDNAEENIDSNLFGFSEWFFSLIEDYEMTERLLCFKAFSRIIGNLDNELDYEIVKEIDEEFKKAKDYHIPDELREKLLKTDKELSNFIELVRKKYEGSIERRGKKESLVAFFDSQKEKYEYLKLLEHDDVDKIKFETGGSYSRNNRRFVLNIINKELGGKIFEGKSTLTILLDLESPSASNKAGYYKYAKKN